MEIVGGFECLPQNLVLCISRAHSALYQFNLDLDKFDLDLLAISIIDAIRIGSYERIHYATAD